MDIPVFQLEAVSRPTLVIDEARARRNIDRMAAKARASGVGFRPHVKTIQLPAVAEWLRAAGVAAITVSSLPMAERFAAAGWTDITVAFPFNPRDLPAANRLAGRIRLGILLEDPAVAAALADGLNAPVDVWIKVDSGYGRTGIPWNDRNRLADLAQVVLDRPRLRLTGVLTHAGHTYSASNVATVRARFAESCRRLDSAAEVVAAKKNGPVQRSVGDTPGCSTAPAFPGVEEIRPGNFVYFDLMQVGLGSCGVEDVAVAVACPVVAVHRERGEVVLCGGAVHLSRERMDGEAPFGRVWRREGGGWGALSTGRIVRQSQEHAVVADAEGASRLAAGDLVLVAPVHACLCAACLGDAVMRIPAERQ